MRNNTDMVIHVDTEKIITIPIEFVKLSFGCIYDDLIALRTKKRQENNINQAILNSEINATALLYISFRKRKKKNSVAMTALKTLINRYLDKE